MSTLSSIAFTLTHRAPAAGRLLIEKTPLRIIRNNAFTIMGLAGYGVDAGLFGHALLTPHHGGMEFAPNLIRLTGAVGAFIGHTLMLAQKSSSGKDSALITAMRRAANVVTFRLSETLKHSKSLAFLAITTNSAAFVTDALINLQHAPAQFVSQITGAAFVFAICASGILADFRRNKILWQAGSKTAAVALSSINLVPAWGLAASSGDPFLMFGAAVSTLSTAAYFLAEYKEPPRAASPLPPRRLLDQKFGR